MIRTLLCRLVGHDHEPIGARCELRPSGFVLSIPLRLACSRSRCELAAAIDPAGLVGYVSNAPTDPARQLVATLEAAAAQYPDFVEIVPSDGFPAAPLTRGPTSAAELRIQVWAAVESSVRRSWVQFLAWSDGCNGDRNPAVPDCVRLFYSIDLNRPAA